MALTNKPSFVAHNGLRFVISDCPSDDNMQAYVDEFLKRNVKLVVRTCEPSYDTKTFNDNGIRVVDMPFPDGDPPPADVITRWLDNVDAEFDSKSAEDGKSVAVHCVAGLGRAPALVAVALVETGLDPLEAVALIRKKRRGAINARQLKWLEAYEPRSKSGACCCVIS